MNAIKALLLGIIAGITDFLPVSSSGHITLFSNILGVEGEIDLMFIIAIHIGTMIAVILVYIKPFKRVLKEFAGLCADLSYNIKVAFSHSSGDRRYKKAVRNQYRKLTVMILIALIPTAVIGILVTTLSESLVGNLLGSGIGLMVSALLLLVASFAGNTYKTPHEAKYVDAVLVGAFQGFSGFPGISRMGMTCSSGMLSGFSLKFTLMFTFLLEIPTVIGAFIVEAIRMRGVVSSVGFLYSFIALIAAAAVGYFVLSLVKKIFSNASSRIFAVYCFVIGIISIVIYIV